MTKITKQKQVVAIYANKYEVIFTDPDEEIVLAYARKHRQALKKAGALKVITNTGYYQEPN